MPSVFFSQTECTVGVYVTAVYDFDYEGKSFTADFWVWGRWRDAEIPFENTFDVSNAKSQEVLLCLQEEIEGWQWIQQKMTAVIHHDWDLLFFPFDSNVLLIQIEDIRDISSIALNVDVNSSGVCDNISNEWNINGFTISAADKIYNTNYGHPASDEMQSSYSEISACISIRRSGSWLTFFKLLSGVYIAFIISLIPFFMKPGTDSRLALPAASLFAVVSNKYITDTIAPSSIYVTLMDKIYTLTFCAMLLIFTVLMLTDNMRVDTNPLIVEKSRRIDTVCVIIFFVLYVVINISFLYI